MTAPVDSRAPGAEARTFPVIWPGVHTRQQIPWSVAERAYRGYSRRWGGGQTMERLAERGGFHVSEMDEFAPGWRDEVSEIERLRREVSELRTELAALRAAPAGEHPDTALLDGLEFILTPGANPVEVFFAGLRQPGEPATAYQCEVEPAEPTWPPSLTYQAPTVRDALRAALRDADRARAAAGEAPADG